MLYKRNALQINDKVFTQVVCLSLYAVIVFVLLCSLPWEVRKIQGEKEPARNQMRMGEQKMYLEKKKKVFSVTAFTLPIGK